MEEVFLSHLTLDRETKRPDSFDVRESLRGISPGILLEQVKNTVPFIFERTGNEIQRKPPYFEFLLQFSGRAPNALPHTRSEMEPTQYFQLCLSAHHATVASFVPTDVDNAIRFKLWEPSLPTETLLEMALLVWKSKKWDCTPVSTRWVRSPLSGEILSGHDGEWLSTAAAAYGALRRRSPESAANTAELVLRELHREAQIFDELKASGDGIALLKASTLIAHNLGDLDRVLDMWKIPDDDPLRMTAYKLGHRERSTPFSQAGFLNKTFMAIENHRHFALRDPRCLRKNADFLLPIGPFFDDWGKTLARHSALLPEDVGEVTSALVCGWQRLQKPGQEGPIGYPRALNGILENFSGGMSSLINYVPARVARELKSGILRNLVSVDKRRFEEKWAKSASRG